MDGTFPWELGYLVDERLRDTGFAVIRGRLTRADHLRLAETLAKDHRFIGMTCQGVFPMIGRIAGNVPDDAGVIEGCDDGYLSLVAGWAHCFRKPNDYLPRRVPRVLFSNSDNMDPDHVWAVATRSGPLTKRWDFCYTCLPDRSNRARKNWDLARRCALRFAEELGLRGLLVGVADVPDAPQHPLLEVRPQLGWAEFLRCLGESRVGFFPNRWDPSPRVMAEALCLNVPLLVNREILGGWKYVDRESGRFFSDERDAVSAMVAIRSRRRWPRHWYCTHFGRANAGPRLAGFLRHLDRRAHELTSAHFYSPRDHGAPPSALDEPPTRTGGELEDRAARHLSASGE